ncbi:MAG: methyl-accepting chemotaxis protein [Planctomycetota bacterium]
MKRAWTIGKKLVVSFLGVAMITLLLGGVGYYGAIESGKAIHQAAEVQLPSVSNLMIIKEAATAIKTAQRTLLDLSLAPEERKAQYQRIQEARDRYGKAWDIYDKLPKSPQEADLWQKLGVAWDGWRKDNNVFIKNSEEFDALSVQDPSGLRADMEKFRGDHYNLVGKSLAAVFSKEVFDGGEDHTQCALGKWMAAFKTQNPELLAVMKEIDEPHHKFHAAVRQVKELIKAGDTEAATELAKKDIVGGSAIVSDYINKLVAQGKRANEIGEAARTHALTACRKSEREVNALLDQLADVCLTASAANATQATNQAAFLKTVSIVAVAVGVAAAIALGIIIARSLNKTLTRIAMALGTGADEVNDAAAQVSSASQQLAEGASQQASSLEETSSALEQMAAMTRTNAENSQKADGLTRQARDAADQGSTVVAELNQAMQGISDASQQISKILKVIEEIAFQTNLLALNAAVEAARAGEHGKGFAVVAEEVRNLAQRAGGAAKEISDLIANSTQRSQEGVKIAENVGTSLGGILTNVKNVSDLVNGIAKGSQEQAQGVEQINIAVSQMDKVTQQNAAGAEEAASASEELAAQAQTLKAMVNELLALVQGDHGDRGNAGPSPTNYNPAQPAKRKTAKPATHFAHLHKTATAHAAASASGHGGAADDNPQYEPAPTEKDSSGGLSAF